MTRLFCSTGRMRPRRGFAVIYVAVIMVAVCGLLSLATDFGAVVLARSELQTAADAAARAAAKSMVQSADQARTDAVQIASANTCDGTAIALDRNQDILFGTWDPNHRTFTATGQASSGAVQIVARRTQDRGNAVPLNFARFVGRESCDVAAVAIATVSVGGGRYGIVGIDSVNFNGNPRTDSYDSSRGPYSASSAGNNGSVASNGNINLNGNVNIRGDARPGQGRRVVKNGNVSISGTQNPVDPALDYPPETAGSAVTQNNNSAIPSKYTSGGNFNVSGNQTVTFPAGTYYFKNFSMSGNADIIIAGAVTLYVNGNINLTGNIDVLNNLPSNFRVVNVSSAGVNISGNGELCADVYAPRSPININGNGEFFGSLVGKSLSLSGNAKIHYDESLGSGGGGGGVSVSLVK